jgi:hypothetical protein
VLDDVDGSLTGDVSIVGVGREDGLDGSEGQCVCQAHMSISEVIIRDDIV